MKVFLSYKSKERKIAESIYFELEAVGHSTFLDCTALQPGESFSPTIERELRSSDLMIFLLTHDSIAPGAYTLTELEIAKEVWRHPEGHVLTVNLEKVPIESLPAYLAATTIFFPVGNIQVEVARQVQKLSGRSLRPDSIEFRGINVVASYEDIRLEARANRPVTTTLELMIGERIVQTATRPYITSVAYAASTLLGFRPRWTVQGNATIGGTVVPVRAEFVTTFVDQYIEIFVDNNRITPSRR